MNGRVLIVNQNYEPLNVCSWQRAVCMIFVGKAVAVERDSKMLRSPTMEMPLPSVVRLNYHVKRPLPEVKISRGSIMARDGYACQYCARKSKHLTLDHVLPRERGGGLTWDNLGACCTDCNNKKGNRTPREAGLRLHAQPRRPRFIPFLSFATFTAAMKHPEWRDYLEPFAPHLIKD